ncbi:MAG: cytochrome c biogenesis protein ResB [Sulfuricella denitrificans]|nr:cytochrome c biogenesis protein ResB [Sulfuricella denitrificans]
MRFAISLLTVLAIASIIGTVLKQNEPYPNYIMQFGQFWFQTFEMLGLYDVYHSSWFLTILAFLILSTSLCIYRNTPLMLREMRSFREHATENSLRAFSHQAEYTTSLPADTLTHRLGKYLLGQGFRAKLGAPGESGDILIAAKSGSYHRIGYLLTHTAIVVICLGGLIDGNIPLKAQQLLGWKKIETRDIPEREVSAASRLSPANLSFRGGVTIPEGAGADVIFINIADGYLVQDLPFDIMLKKFRVEHYPTGQPKSFESDITLIDKATKESVSRTISVNHPLVYKGIAIYQASFGDGGTRLSMKGWNLFSPTDQPFDMKGAVKQDTKLSNGGATYTVEFTEFRKFNIENFAGEDGGTSAMDNLNKFFQTGSTKRAQKDLRNVGPSFQYKIRDAQGQAREYFNYMLPIQFEDRWYLLSGMRMAPNEPFRYIRFPLDRQSNIDGFMRLRAVLLDKQTHPEIARHFAEFALQGEKTDPALRAKLVDSTIRILDVFASGGYEAMAKLIEKSVPAAEQDKVAQTYLKILESSTLSAWRIAQSRIGQPVVMDEITQGFVRDSLNSVSDLFSYGAPVYLQLAEFDEVMASGLQLTRSPGKNIVYGGSALLVLGVFFMFYIRERRVWLLVQPRLGTVLFATSTNRKTMDFEQEFNRHKTHLIVLLKE